MGNLDDYVALGLGATEGMTLVEFAAFIFNWIFMERLRVGRGVASEGGI